MGFISWIVLGLIAGALAKLLMPGKDGGGFIITTLLGIGGAIVGGYIGSFLGLGATSGLSIASILTATAGAFLLLFAYRLVKQPKKESETEVSE
ncbi:MAG: GlsB/YeaQ/YmgE family stress response membrane protein [Candidatus Thiodiazotropha sp. (ex Lucinoma kastoroae)]|nr:GlsB/YeaQ/YmgE family stress response membrane protein [Candidatus Thiodiazotropha sp. (ex Rostrolucina anterorostrata)]MCU7849059.1 GlsB/YeaQ/YmgE family stress response membrane protein [Candidatus Thiodiazotropha sp. (ex Lucinoma kastoroae)]